jgi:S-adenosylmethionine:tRNA ribosyltransferase-isomerase
VKISELDFDLPDELIADRPAGRREDARMLVVNRGSGRMEHSHIHQLSDWLRPGDLLVLNDTRVLAARVLAEKATGGRVEFLFVEQASSSEADGWWAMAKPGRRLHPGMRLCVKNPDGRPAAQGEERIEIIDRRADGMFLVRPEGIPVSGVAEWLNRVGLMPLPPYIRKRRGEEGLLEHAELDRERYQTVFAREGSAVAAPTAGLHFTPDLLRKLEGQGIRSARVRLDVGPGTFLPVKTETLEDHPIHGEYYRVQRNVAEEIRRTKEKGGRVIAVGTTSVRTLESAAASIIQGQPSEGVTHLFILPGYRFQLIDGMLTNFHLPRSTLLALVGAFCGLDVIMDAYQEAIRQQYRFYSYGDCMLLL